MTSSTVPGSVDPYKTSRIGAVQAEPAWLNLQAGVDKVIQLIQDASTQKVELLGFPEVFIRVLPSAEPLGFPPD